MGLEEYIPDESVGESGGASADKAKESSDKYKKQASKSAAGIKRTTKDEKKVKTYDMLLAGFLVKIIVNKKYDILLESLFIVLHKGYPSNFVLGIISLVYNDVSKKIREVSGKTEIEFNYFSEQIIEFDDLKLNNHVKERINLWIEDIVDSVSIEYSSLMTKKLINLLETDEKILIFISTIFTFFLKNININISLSKSQNISEFILSEILTKIKKLNLDEI